MAYTTTRLGLIVPEGTDDNKTTTYIAGIANKLDAAAMYSSGTLATRPTSTPASPGLAGRFYYATDTAQAYLDTGTGWLPIGREVGDLVTYGAGSLPTGCIAADGQAVSRSTYSLLFAKWGTTFGAGNGTSTFNVIDMRGSAPIGPDAGTGRVSWATAVGVRGGSEKHGLTAAENGPHNHGGLTGPPDSPLSFGYYRSNSENWAVASGSAITVNKGETFVPITLFVHYHSIATDGSGTPHNNMQPSTVVNFAIYTGVTS